jgi:predicted permease
MQSPVTRTIDIARLETRRAVRSLRQSPAVSVVVIATLAIVIGANTALFGLMNAAFMERLSLPAAEELRAVYPMNRGAPDDISMTEFDALSESPRVPHMAAYWNTAATIESGTTRTDVWADMVSGGFLSLLGVRPVMGRLLNDADERANSPVAVISEALWAQLYGRSPDVIGKTIRINGQPATIVGILPHSFHSIHFARTFSVALPLRSTQFASTPINTRLLGLFLVARVIPGRERQERSALDVAYRSCCLDATSGNAFADGPAVALPPGNQPAPGDAPTGLGRVSSSDLTPHVEMHDASYGVRWSTDYRATYSRVLLGVGAGVVILLLIACANIATLLLARAAAREREFAVQLSMGAARARIIRQLLAESVALAVPGTVCGVIAAWAGTTFLVRHLPRSATTLSSVVAFHMSPRLMLFTALITGVCVLLFGLWPAIRASRTDILTPLHGVRTQGERTMKLDRVLVVSQVAFALILLGVGSLLIRTLGKLSPAAADVADHVAMIRIERSDTRLGKMPEDIANAELISAIAAVSDVRDVAVARDAPMLADNYQQIQINDREFAKGKMFPRMNVVTERFFGVAGIPIVNGRAFDATDVKGAENVAVISEAFALRYFGPRNPVGATMSVNEAGDHVRIVGVAQDESFDDPRAVHSEMMYLPLSQQDNKYPSTMATLLVRTEGKASASLRDLREQLEHHFAGIHLAGVTTMSAEMESALSRERLAAGLAAVFGIISLALVSVGIYGLLSHNTARRKHEIGVRMALGAETRHAVWLVLRESLLLIGAGVVIGAPLAYAAAMLVRSQLFEVSPTDPRALIVGGTLLLAAGLIASALPSRRAALVDPLEALRSD